MIECVLGVEGEMIRDHILDIAVIEDGSARELCRRSFCVAENLLVAFDRPYYFAGDDGTARVECGAMRAESPIGADEYVFVPFGEGDMKVKVPIVSWRLEPQPASVNMKESGAVWHGDIARGTRLVAVCPGDVGCRLRVGGKMMECERLGNGEVVFDLGSLLESDEFGRDEEIVQAELVLDGEGDNSSRALFPVCLRETFGETPRFEMRDRILSLKNPWAFVGPSSSQLEFSFKGREGESYRAMSGESVLSGDCDLPHGNYQYRVFLLPDGESPDDGKKMIYSGACLLGDVDIFHFDNKLLEIRRVRSGFKEFFILPIYVENLEFVETKARYDDGVAYPIYSGVCYYLNREDEKVYFGDDFNPVQVVIINGRDVCLYRNDGSKPCLIYESRHKITSTKPDSASGIISYVPDFYEYEALEGN
jgi:hypothetical protein